MIAGPGPSPVDPPPWERYALSTAPLQMNTSMSGMSKPIEFEFSQLPNLIEIMNFRYFKFELPEGKVIVGAKSDHKNSKE